MYAIAYLFLFILDENFRNWYFSFQGILVQNAQHIKDKQLNRQLTYAFPFSQSLTSTSGP